MPHPLPPTLHHDMQTGLEMSIMLCLLLGTNLEARAYFRRKAGAWRDRLEVER